MTLVVAVVRPGARAFRVRARLAHALGTVLVVFLSKILASILRRSVWLPTELTRVCLKWRWWCCFIFNSEDSHCFEHRRSQSSIKFRSVVLIFGPECVCTIRSENRTDTPTSAQGRLPKWSIAFCRALYGA